MERSSYKMIAALSLILCLAAPALAEEATDSFKDTPYFSGMSSYEIVEGIDHEFDETTFYDGKGATVIEGRQLWRTYTQRENAKLASDLQITRNYAQAVRSMGGTVLFEGVCEDDACGDFNGFRMVIGKIKKGGDELWMMAVPYNDGYNYQLIVAVKEAMVQDVTAGALFDALNRDGHVALYINFDTGKSTIKPDSQAVIDQVAQMLKSNPALKLSVEGHTDNVGSAKSNKTLSEERARAVVAALAKQGIDAKRLTSMGHGQDKPVDSNDTESSRAKNRRVELVKK